MRALIFVEICPRDILNLVKISMRERLACARKKKGVDTANICASSFLIKIHARVNARDLPIYN